MTKQPKNNESTNSCTQNFDHEGIKVDHFQTSSDMSWRLETSIIFSTVIVQTWLLWQRALPFVVCNMITGPQVDSPPPLFLRAWIICICNYFFYRAFPPQLATVLLASSTRIGNSHLVSQIVRRIPQRIRIMNIFVINYKFYIIIL